MNFGTLNCLLINKLINNQENEENLFLFLKVFNQYSKYKVFFHYKLIV